MRMPHASQRVSYVQFNRYKHERRCIAKSSDLYPPLRRLPFESMAEI